MNAKLSISASLKCLQGLERTIWEFTNQHINLEGYTDFNGMGQCGAIWGFYGAKWAI